MKVLLAFSWGEQFPEPGLSNEVMAKKILEIKNDFDHVLVQIEIGLALKKLGFHAEDIVGKSGIYINTRQVADEMFKWLRAKNIDPHQAELWVLCHRTHWSGLQLIFHKLGYQVKRIPADVPYDPKSHQWQTRGPLGAFLGKIVHGVGYLIRGEL